MLEYNNVFFDFCAANQTRLVRYIVQIESYSDTRLYIPISIIMLNKVHAQVLRISIDTLTCFIYKIMNNSGNYLLFMWPLGTSFMSYGA